MLSQARTPNAIIFRAGPGGASSSHALRESAPADSFAARIVMSTGLPEIMTKQGLRKTLAYRPCG